MRILCVNCVISEFGGVEFASVNLARELAKRGHEIHFLGARGAQPQLLPRGSQAQNSQPALDQLQLHYGEFPRIHPMGEQHGAVYKLIWHAQDLLHPANERIFGRILRDVRPDIVLLHNITSVGLNIWRTIAKAGTPCVQVVHDLSLICMNMSQFRDGKPCAGVCAACAIYKSVRFSMINKNSRFAFVAPSRGIMEVIERHVDLSPWPRAIIPNANTFLVHQRNPANGTIPELLYVGRLDPAKGVSIMMEAASLARQHTAFKLHILGAGSLESELRNTYNADWVTFHGSVTQDSVANFMARATLLLIPSLWPETVPGVAVHALYAGLPVLASRIGGIPEHVFEGKTGFLLPPGDVDAWRTAIEAALQSPDLLKSFSAESVQQATRFDADLAVSRYENFMKDFINQGRCTPHPVG